MVALFSSRDGRSLNVLLTTRSLSMRTYVRQFRTFLDDLRLTDGTCGSLQAGNTALPGGKADPTDSDLVETARREGNLSLPSFRFTPLGLTLPLNFSI